MCYWHVGSNFSVGAVSLDHKHDVFEAATLNSSWDSFSEFRTALAEFVCLSETIIANCIEVAKTKSERHAVRS